jgi:hypothetical protein
MPAVLMTFAVLFMAVTAPAQVDPDPNGVGIYFDLAATQNALTVAIPPGGHVDLVAYLVATRVSAPGFVRNVAGRVAWDQNDVYPAGGLHGWDPCREWAPVPLDDYICAWFGVSVLAIGDAVVLRSYGVRLYDTGRPLRFFIPEMSLTTWNNVEITLHPSSGNASLPVAVINGEAPVSVESAPWGSLKALYR